MTPGKTSTEFYALIAAIVMVMANGSQYINIPTDQLQWAFGLIAAYIGSRTVVKAANAKKEG